MQIGLRLYCCSAILALATTAASGQAPPPPPAPAKVDLTGKFSPSGTEPIAEDAFTAMFAAFKSHQLVGMGAGHGNKNLDDFILKLVSDPRFPGGVNDVAVECGNSLYQATLDRYMAGESIPEADLRKVWRNTSQSMCGLSSFYERLFPMLRQVNLRLPPGKRIRVLATDVPIEWETIHNRDDLQQAPDDRDASIASIVEEQVLSRHRKALLLFGTAHLFHQARSGNDEPSAVAIYEERFPGVTWVIADHDGFGIGTPYEPLNDRFESRMAGWKVPTLISGLKGTWLADVLDTESGSSYVTVFTPKKSGGRNVRTVLQRGERRFTTMVDGYLYLGPRRALKDEAPSASALGDSAFMAELHRRATLLGVTPRGAEDAER